METESGLRQSRTEEARWRWKHHDSRGGNGRKLSLSFDELYGLFQNDCNSFTDIGRLSNPPVTRERIRQIYREYFADAVGRPNGQTRIRVCTLKRWNYAASELPSQFPARQIAEKAIEQGFRCVQIAYDSPSNSRYNFQSRRLWINGKLVALRGTNTVANVSKSVEYVHWSTHPHIECGYHVFVAAIDGYPMRFFVVPTVDLVGKSSGVYARLDANYRYKKRNGRWNGGWLAQYEDAWHYLK